MVFQKAMHKAFLLLFVFLIQTVASLPVSQAQEDINAFVDSWLNAWAAQNPQAYFSHYHPDFEAVGFNSNEDWRNWRSANINRPEAIVITREGLNIRELDNGYEVDFWFSYESPDYADRTHKFLLIRADETGSPGIISEQNLALETYNLQAARTADTQSNTNNDSGQLETADLPSVGEIDNNNTAPLASRPDSEETQAQETDSSPTETANPTTAPSARPSVNSDWVPPGFENLNQPQVTEIDVYYGGFYLTSVLAEFTDREVSILDRERLIENLPGLKDPQGFELLLDNTFDAHTELLCFSEFQVDCGTLETDSVELIFDRSALRMWLFIAPTLLQSATSEQLRFLPPSGAGLTYLNQSALYFSGEEDEIESYNLYTNNMFAWRENRLAISGNLADDDFELDTFALMREFQGRDYRLGLFRETANGFSFMSNERFVGASFSSSLLTRTDLEQSLGTEIELFFPTRSRVEIFREGRLISTEYYDVGNRLLDTSSLPNGSYTIEIRIFDAAGNMQVEERFFSKTSRIPPADQPLYFIHAGQLENDLDRNRLSRTGDDYFIRSGYSKRLTQSIGGNLGFSYVGDSGMLETGIFKQGRQYEAQANIALEDGGTSGLDLRFRYRHENFNLTFNMRQVLDGLQDSQIGQEYRQYNSMLEVPLRYGYLSLFYRDVKRPLTAGSDHSGLRYRSRTRNFMSGTLSSSFELSSNNEELLAVLSFSYQLQGNNNITSYTPKAVYADESSNYDSGLYGSYEQRWYAGQQNGNEYRYGIRADYDDRKSLEARFESDTRLGSSDLMAYYNDDTENTEISGRLSTSFASDGRSGAFGGKRRSESAFLVRVEGDVESDTRFNVLVNGIARGQTRVGQTLLVPVSPYETYDVELQSIGDTLVNLDNRVYRETVYPGNVVNLSWYTRTINIALGRLLDVNGQPLQNAVIQNVIGLAMTDDNGYFQAEIDHSVDSFEVLSGAEQCEVSFSNPQSNDMVLQLGTLQCQ